MSTRHRLLAAVVTILWGVNFTAIHASLQTFPPLLCAAIRFALLAVPTLLFVPRPTRADGSLVPARWLLGYGLGFGVAQFAFLYTGMAAGMPAGLASLVLQASGPFTLVLGALLLAEPVRRRQGVGVAVAVAGLGVVGMARAATASPWPFVLVLAGALGWAFGNLASRQAAPAQPLRLALWMSVVPPLPMLALSLAVEGPARIGVALRAAGTAAALPAWLGLLYTVLLATVVGSGLWTWLLARHPAGVVAPFSMLVPVVGMSVAALALGERPAAAELVGAVLVIAGVLIGSGGARVRRTTSDPTPATGATQAVVAAN
ncbi:MAG: EamA family transporter [Austwickia sp.]|nr:MAG: EamA family transporter [Austwickia sp.]